MPFCDTEMAHFHCFLRCCRRCRFVHADDGAAAAVAVFIFCSFYFFLFLLLSSRAIFHSCFRILFFENFAFCNKTVQFAIAYENYMQYVTNARCLNG